MLYAAICVFIVSTFADAYTTYLGLESGRGREKNPVSAWIIDRSEPYVGTAWSVVLAAVVKDFVLIGIVGIVLYKAVSPLFLAWYLLIVSALQFYVARKNWRLVKSWE